MIVDFSSSSVSRSPNPSGGGPGSGIRGSPNRPLALVVEDDPDAARVAADMLGILGYRTQIATSGEEGLQTLDRWPPALILLDVCLLQMDGLAFLKVVRRVAQVRSVPVVAASAVYPPESRTGRGLREFGVVSYLTKPFNLAGLRGAVREADPRSPAPAGEAPGRPSPSFRLDEIVGQARTAGREGPVALERSDGAALVLRSAALPLTDGDWLGVSLELPVPGPKGLLSGLPLQLRGTVHLVEERDFGWRARFVVRSARPREAWLRLLDRLAPH
jgi:CheY-like chemotaxis protein